MLLFFPLHPYKTNHHNPILPFPVQISNRLLHRRQNHLRIYISVRLAKFPVPDFVWEEYHLDQEINDRGIEIDMDVVTNAIFFDDCSKGEIAELALGYEESVGTLKAMG